MSENRIVLKTFSTAFLLSLGTTCIPMEQSYLSGSPVLR